MCRPHLLSFMKMKRRGFFMEEVNMSPVAFLHSVAQRRQSGATTLFAVLLLTAGIGIANHRFFFFFAIILQVFFCAYIHGLPPKSERPERFIYYVFQNFCLIMSRMGKLFGVS